MLFKNILPDDRILKVLSDYKISTWTRLDIQTYEIINGVNSTSKIDVEKTVKRRLKSTSSELVVRISGKQSKKIELDFNPIIVKEKITEQIVEQKRVSELSDEERRKEFEEFMKERMTRFKIKEL